MQGKGEALGGFGAPVASQPRSSCFSLAQRKPAGSRRDPQPIAGWIVVIVAGVALAVDVWTAILTFAMSKGNLNVKAAFLHNVSDAAASVGVMLAGTLILLFQWYWTDLVATLIISAYILWGGVAMMRSTIRILMDSVPEGVDLHEVVAAMQSVEHVRDVHHLHLWQLDENHIALEAHVVIDPLDFAHLEKIKAALREMLHERFAVEHSTLEIETPAEAAAENHATGVVVNH